MSYLSEFIGLQRGFRLQTRTYSLLLTVSKNFTYTLWYIVLASPKYPRYYTQRKRACHRSQNKDNQIILHAYWHIYFYLHCSWLRRLSFHLSTRAQTSVAEPFGLSRWLEVHCLLSLSPGHMHMTQASVCSNSCSIRKWNHECSVCTRSDKTFFPSVTFKMSISSFLTTNSSLSRYIPSPPLSDSSSSVSPSMATLINCTANWLDGVSLNSSLATNTVLAETVFVVCVGGATCGKQVSVTVCGMVGT